MLIFTVYEYFIELKWEDKKMAKFCAKCGAHMEDSDLVCGQCGTPSGDAGPPVFRRSTMKFPTFQIFSKLFNFMQFF